MNEIVNKNSKSNQEPSLNDNRFIKKLKSLDEKLHDRPYLTTSESESKNCYLYVFEESVKRVTIFLSSSNALLDLLIDTKIVEIIRNHLDRSKDLDLICSSAFDAQDSLLIEFRIRSFFSKDQRKNLRVFQSTREVDLHALSLLNRNENITLSKLEYCYNDFKESLVCIDHLKHFMYLHRNPVIESLIDYIEEKVQELEELWHII